MTSSSGHESDLGVPPAPEAMYAKYRAAADSAIHGTPLNRGDRMKEQGTMTKAAGSAQNRGQFTSDKGQPDPKTAKQRSSLANVHLRIGDAMPGELCKFPPSAC